GYIVIVVPPSTRAPHAVTPPRGNSFTWPVRHGSQTNWLSESALADAYRTRASRVADEGRRLQQVLEEAVRQFESKDPWLVSALVPAGSRPADPIDRQLVTDYTEWFRQAERTVPNGYGSIAQGHAVAGQRRVVLRYNPTPGK